MQIKRIFEGKNVLPIVFAFNNDYSKYFSVALQSLIENSNNIYFYDIIVFSSDISERNKKLLESMLPKNFSLRFFDVSIYINQLLEDIQLSGYKYWSVEMYYRIVIPIIMRNYERVLYLDSDTISKKDITPLFNTNFENKQIVAVMDAFNLISNLEECQETKDYLLRELKIKSVKSYFNSGVILFNIQKICPERYIERLKEAFKIELTNCPDQDVLNSIFVEQVKFVSQEWNLQYHIPILYDRHLDSFNKDDLLAYNLAFDNPAIIHYTSPVKPWFAPKLGLAVDFWRYARKTDYYEEILYSMYQNEIANSRFATHLYMKLQENKKVILWGASIFLEDFINRYRISTENILGIIDINTARQGQTLNGYKIYPPEILKSLEYEEIILTIVNGQDERYEDIKNYLIENNLTHVRFSKL